MSLVPILQHFCFEKGWVFTYDDIVAVAAHNAGIDLKQSLPVLLLDLLSSVKPTTEFSLKEEGESSVKLTGKKINAQFPSIAKSGYLTNIAELTKWHEAAKVKLPISYLYPDDYDLLTVMAQCFAQNTALEMQAGVIIELGKQLQLTVTDNVTLTHYERGLKKEKEPLCIIVPVKFFRELSRLRTLIDNEQVEKGMIHISKSSISFNFGGKALLLCKCSEFKSKSKLDNIINQYPVKNLTKIPNAFRSAVQRAALLLKGPPSESKAAALMKGEAYKNVQLIITEKTISLKSVGHATKLDEAVAWKPKKWKGTIKTAVHIDSLSRAVGLFDSFSFEHSSRVIVFKTDNLTHYISTMLAADEPEVREEIEDTDDIPF